MQSKNNVLVSLLTVIAVLLALNLLVSRKAELREKRSLIILITAETVDLRREEAERFGKGSS